MTPLPNKGEIYLKTSAGTILTTAFAFWGPLTSTYSGFEVDAAEIKNTTFFYLPGFTQGRLATKLVKQGHYVWVDASESYLITGLKDWGSHTELVGLRQSVPVGFEVSTGLGIISQYEFRSTAGLVTDEKSLNALTNNNSVTQSSDVPSHLSSEVGSAVFVSASSQYFSRTDAAAVRLDITGPCTIAFWLKPTTHGSTMGLVSKAVATPNAGYYLYKNGAGNILFELSNDGTATDTAQSASVPALSTWGSIAAVYNGTDIRIYLNAALDSNGSSNPKTHSTGIFNNGQIFAVGCRGDAAQFLNGRLANLFVCDQAKTAAEILEWHTTGVMP